VDPEPLPPPRRHSPRTRLRIGLDDCYGLETQAAPALVATPEFHAKGAVATWLLLCAKGSCLKDHIEAPASDDQGASETPARLRSLPSAIAVVTARPDGALAGRLYEEGPAVK
jgi:hypothetical protein